MIERINAAAVAELNSPELRKAYEDRGIIPGGGTPEEFGHFIQSEVAKWKQLAAAVGIKRSAKQVVDRTMRELSSTKPSFVDGAANAFTARVLTRLVPSRVLIAVTGRLMGRN